MKDSKYSSNQKITVAIDCVIFGFDSEKLNLTPVFIVKSCSVMTPPTKFTPLVTFTYGREGKMFRDFVKHIGATYVHQKFGIDASDDSGMRLRQRVINNIWRRASCAMMIGNCEVLKQGEHRIYHAQRHLPARGVGRASNLLIRPLT